MSGRDVVRAMRETGRPPDEPASSNRARPLLLAVAIAAMSAGAVYCMILFAPLIPFLSIEALQTTRVIPEVADGQTRAVAEAGTFAGLTRKELDACQNAARPQDYRTARGSLATGQDTGAVIAQAASLACLARTRPAHLCNPDGAYQFLTIALAETESFRKAIDYLSHPEAIAKSGDPSVAGLPRLLVMQAFDDIRGTVVTANNKAKAAIRQAARQGVLQPEIARTSGLGSLSADAVGRLLDGVALGPNACI